MKIVIKTRSLFFCISIRQFVPGSRTILPVKSVKSNVKLRNQIETLFRLTVANANSQFSCAFQLIFTQQKNKLINFPAKQENVYATKTSLTFIPSLHRLAYDQVKSFRVNFIFCVVSFAFHFRQ